MPNAPIQMGNKKNRWLRLYSDGGEERVIRVLHVMGCGDAGGISTVVLNYYRFIDRTKIHFDIALTVPEVGQNAEALQAMGAKLYFLPMKSTGLRKFRNSLKELLKQGNYDAIHVHESETSYIALQVAKQLGVTCRVAHAHTTSPYLNFSGEIRRLSGCLLNYHYATCVIGCGQLAGERIFGKYNMKRERAMVLPNAIDTTLFDYDPQVRDEVRRELGLEDKFVMGMVGRLAEQKNTMYALELLPQLLRYIPHAVLVVAGNGPEEETLHSRIAELGMEHKVTLLGRRADVARLYQAFDIFLMPSLFEGYPLAAVEALATGLPVLLSDAITRELRFGSAVEYLPLSHPEQWIKTILLRRISWARKARAKEVAAHGLDIRDTVKTLENVYLRDLGVEVLEAEV